MTISSKRLLKGFALILIIQSIVLLITLRFYTITKHDIIVNASIREHEYKPRIEFLGQSKPLYELVLVNKSYEEIFSEYSGCFSLRIPLNIPMNFDGNMTIYLVAQTLQQLVSVEFRLTTLWWDTHRALLIYRNETKIHGTSTLVNISHTIIFKDLLKRLNGCDSILTLYMLIKVNAGVIVVRIHKLKILLTSKRGIIRLIPMFADGYGDFLFSEAHNKNLPVYIRMRYSPHIIMSLMGRAELTFHSNSYDLTRIIYILVENATRENITGTPIYLCVGDLIDFKISYRVGPISGFLYRYKVNITNRIPSIMKLWLPVYYLKVVVRGNRNIPMYVTFTTDAFDYLLDARLHELTESSKKPKAMPIVPAKYNISIFIETWRWESYTFELLYPIQFTSFGDPVLIITIQVHNFIGIILPKYLFLFALIYIVECSAFSLSIIVKIMKWEES